MRDRVEIEVDITGPRTRRVTYESKADALSAAVWLITHAVSFQCSYDPPVYRFTVYLTEAEIQLLTRHVGDMVERLDLITYDSVSPPS
jgi:hypothetical protein